MIQRTSPPLTIWLSVIASAAMLYGCGKAAAPEKTSHRSLPDNYVQGSFVIAAEVTTSDKQLAAATKQVGDDLGCEVGAPERIVWDEAGTEGGGVVSENLEHTYNVRYANCDFSKDGTQAIVEQLAGTSEIAGAEAEAVAAATPIVENDTFKSSQEHLKFIRRDQACAIAARSEEPVIIAVVDSGVDIDHPDLQSAFLRDGSGEIIGANFVGSGSQMPPDREFDDQNGHGTHVAGLAAASANNGMGVVGIAACANVKIMPIRVLGADGKGNSIEIDRGIKWATDRGAHIINLSLGYSSTYTNKPTGFYKSLYAELANKDVIVIAAAGNDGYDNGGPGEEGTGFRYHFPSTYDNVISVAATNSSGFLTSFSNRGERVDIAAPGNSVLSTLMGGEYGRMSGTSMASPVAAGAYALALATAKAGLESGIDRVDATVAETILKQSTLNEAEFSSTEVASGGVINVEAMVAAMKAKFPETTLPEQPFVTPPPTPVTPVTPVTPTQPTRPVTPPLVSQPPQTAAFAFDGITNNQRAGAPQKLAVKNLPAGTRAVYFYWGTSPWSFSKLYTRGGETKLKDSDRWYLYGTRTLKAVAFNNYGRIVGVTTITLKGL